MSNIAQVNVSQVLGSRPSTLQQTGALISQGATSLAAGGTALVTQVSDFTAVQAAPLAIASANWSGGVVTVQTTAAITGLQVNDTFLTQVANMAPVGYNGTFSAIVTGTNTFTYALSSSPGTVTASGTYTPGNQVELLNAVTDFFAQGASRAVTVLELGPSDYITGPPLLSAWINANPRTFYLYLAPKSWDNGGGPNGPFITLAKQFLANNAMTYFFVTTTVAPTYAQYAGMKSVQWWVEAPGVASTEFDASYAFQAALSYAPSSVNMMTQFGFTYLNGGTPYPTQGNQGLLSTITTANGNYVDTPAEGGLTGEMVSSGNMADGNDFSYWYSVDWIQINTKQAAAALSIQGSNTPSNPLWYNQNGINRVQDTEVGVLEQAVAFQLTTGPVLQTALDQATFQANLNDGLYDGFNVVNAIPFATYLAANPNDYTQGRYAGITVAYIPSRGFKHLVFNIEVTNFANAGA